jgi:putative holliday junction resolvase
MESNMARLLALDVGEARIGVAISDASGILASPYTTLRTSRDEAQTWNAIQRLLDETGAEGLVVGLPVSLDGQLHAQAERVRDFARRLQEHIHMPLVFWDERYSTVEAQRLLAERYQDANQMGRRGPGKRARQRGRRTQETRYGIDALAATVILQEYLDHLTSKVNENKE